MRNTVFCVILGGLVGWGACVPSPKDTAATSSPEGRAIMALQDELREQHGVDLRSATVLDGINTNVMRVDMRSNDKTLDERITTAQRIARFLKEKNAIPRGHYRIAFDFPVSFQVGCMPVNLYERVQLELAGLQVIQKLPAQRIMANDNLTRGEMGKVILDDTQWNIPFFVNVDGVEIAHEVMGVEARPDEVFVSVHATWTNIGRNTATMTDDPWRLVDGSSGARKGELVALLDGGQTHLARNGGRIKMPPVEPGKSQSRWYVYRVAKSALGAPLAFARQRYAKANSQQKEWTKAGFELWVQVKNGFAPNDVVTGKPLMAYSEDWRQAVDATADPRAVAMREEKL